MTDRQAGADPSIALPGVPLLRRGKVREVYDLGEHVLLVASDRLSAFDVVLPTPIPDKGRVLTQISAFWFARTTDIVANHLVSVDVDAFPAALAPFRDRLAGRSMLCRKARRLDVECVARGYLFGSAWAEYRRSGTIGGEPAPAGLRESDRLPQPVFTPTTKAESGHDEPMSFEQVRADLGGGLAERVRDLTLAIYRWASDYAAGRGIIIADTKLEFGLIDDELVLIDELLTPDSSRFWPIEGYQPGGPQPSFDKQFVRDYLESTGWDKRPPGPPLPTDVVARTREKYHQAYRQLVGRDLER